MFIPQGKPKYEDLATSYVLVDALVDDLCAEGFSGMVKVTLADADRHVILDRGRVAAVLERRGAGDYAATTVAELALRSRGERGRVSVYQYPAGVGGILARSLAAEPLYLRLSSDFADLGKMIAKLAREQDREWFIHVAPAETAAALIHLEGGGCRVIRPEGSATGEEVDSPDPSTNAALGDLVNECNQAACSFDVFFRRIAESAEPGIAPVQINTVPAAAATVAEVQPVAAATEAEVVEAFRPEPVVADEPLSAQYESSSAGSAGEEKISDATVREPETAWTQPSQELPRDSFAESRQAD
ncbi:MAG TPA: hypothetical protein VNO70_15325, partial [Blastocatellia bacterium]|nr:hypothetical protein [Blastocatellia bacterium]